MGRWSEPEQFLQAEKDRQTDSNEEYSHSNRVLLVHQTQVGEISDLEVFCHLMLPVSLFLASTCSLILLLLTCVWKVGIPVPSGNLRVSLAVVWSQSFENNQRGLFSILSCY